MNNLTSKANEPLRRTTVTPLLPQIGRKAALGFLHDHGRMIELNPLTIRHEASGPAPNATFDEVTHYSWFLVTDAVSWIPGGSVKADVSYKIAYWSLPDGLKVHTFAPRGVDIQSFWSLEEKALGSSKRVCIREDVEVRCQPSVAKFVTRNLERSHAVLIEAILAKMEEDQHRKTIIKEIVAQGFALKENRQASLESSTDTSTTYLSSCNSSVISPRTIPHWVDSEARCAKGDHGTKCPHSFSANCGPIDAFYPVGVAELPGAAAGVLPPPSPTESKASAPTTTGSSRTSSPPSVTESSGRPSTDTNTSVESLYSPVADRPCFCEDGRHEKACPFSVAPLAPGDGKYPAPIVPPRSHRRYVEIPKDVASKVKAINSSKPAVHRQLAGAKSMAALQMLPSRKSPRPRLHGKESFYGYVAGAQSVDALHGPTSAPRQDVEKHTDRSKNKSSLYQQTNAARSADSLPEPSSGTDMSAKDMSANNPLPTSPSASKPSFYRLAAGVKSMNALMKAQSEISHKHPLDPHAEETQSPDKDPIIPSFLEDFKTSSERSNARLETLPASTYSASKKQSPYRHKAGAKSVDSINIQMIARPERKEEQPLPAFREENQLLDQEPASTIHQNKSKTLSEKPVAASLESLAHPSTSTKPSLYRHNAGAKSMDAIDIQTKPRLEKKEKQPLPALPEENQPHDQDSASPDRKNKSNSRQGNSLEVGTRSPATASTSNNPFPYRHKAGAKSVDAIGSPVRAQPEKAENKPLPPFSEEKQPLKHRPIGANPKDNSKSIPESSATADAKPMAPTATTKKPSPPRHGAGDKQVDAVRSPPQAQPGKAAEQPSKEKQVKRSLHQARVTPKPMERPQPTPEKDTSATKATLTPARPAMTSEKPSPYRHVAGAKSVDALRSPVSPLPERSVTPTKLALPSLSEEDMKHSSLFADFLAASSLEAFLASPSVDTAAGSGPAPAPAVPEKKPTPAPAVPEKKPSPYKHVAGAKSVDFIHKPTPSKDRMKNKRALPLLPEEQVAIYQNSAASQSMQAFQAPGPSSDHKTAAIKSQPLPPSQIEPAEKESKHRNLVGAKSKANLRGLVSHKHEAANKEPQSLPEDKQSSRRQLPKTTRLITHWDGTTTGYSLQSVAK